MKESSDRQQDRADIFYLKKSWRIGKMKAKSVDKVRDEPFCIIKTEEDIKSCRKKPVKLKLQRLWAQMEFFHKAMSEKAKRIREKLKKGEL